ncbi:MAG TPA: Holliday junction resolvase RuvX [Propionibacteriaceae bacterium]
MSDFRTGVRLALDWGEARIGVAACDRDGVLAFPIATVRAGDAAVTELIALIADYDPIEVLVGLPRSLSGGEGPAALRMRGHAQRLATVCPVPVRLVDERLTTVTAARHLRESGKKSKQQRAVIDAASAVAILEQALALERGRGEQPGELVSAPGRPG